MTHLYHEDPKKSWNPVKRLSHCHCAKINDGNVPGWFSRVLMLFIPHLDIIKAIDIREGKPQVISVYLRRFYLFRAKWIGFALAPIVTLLLGWGWLMPAKILVAIADFVNRHVGDVYLHNIIRSDDDPDPHNHPWGFLGFVISGGYVDEQYTWEPAHLIHEQNISIIGQVVPEIAQFPKVVVGDQRFVSVPGSRIGPTYEAVRPRRFIRRAAEHIHRVIVPNGRGAWTIIFTSPYCREWEFVTEKGPVLWTTYLGIPEGQDVGT